ncbi:hypothetical protein BJ165DRAFT_1496203 [Panaeolus papilionaceus]|nr:hypothetical protein BJ165DRAFT_1496203 [Panaeolus papilionaceus]
MAAAWFLEYMQDFIHNDCYVSADVVSALETLSWLVFPPDVVSTLEDTTFLFDTSPSSVTRKQRLKSFCSPCELPRWFLDTDGPRPTIRGLGALHDYMRLFYLHRSARVKPNEHDESGEEDLDDMEDAVHELNLIADDFQYQVVNPATDRCFTYEDFNTWSLHYRLDDFIRDCNKEKKVD